MIEGTLERDREVSVDLPEQIDCRGVVAVRGPFAESVARDGVRGGDRGVDGVCREDIRCVEQLGRLEELAGVDQALSCLALVTGCPVSRCSRAHREAESPDRRCPVLRLWVNGVETLRNV